MELTHILLLLLLLLPAHDCICCVETILDLVTSYRVWLLVSSCSQLHVVMNEITDLFGRAIDLHTGESFCIILHLHVQSSMMWSTLRRSHIFFWFASVPTVVLWHCTILTVPSARILTGGNTKPGLRFLHLGGNTHILQHAALIMVKCREINTRWWRYVHEFVSVVYLQMGFGLSKLFAILVYIKGFRCECNKDKVMGKKIPGL